MPGKANAGRYALIAAGCVFMMSAADAHAINRYMSTSMTCAEVGATIAREGAAIMRYQSPRTGMLLYDRYVRDRGFCLPGQASERRFIPTSDQPACPVNRCKEIELPDFR